MTTLGWAPRFPEHWKIVPLNFVASMGTGHTPDRSKPEYWENCTIPWITLTDASRHAESLAPLTDTYQQISEVGMRNSAAVLHPAGTVVLSRTASVGHSAIMGRPMATTQDFATWICGSSLDSRYLLFVLRAMKPEWERLAFGSTHRTIYMPDLESLRIPLPSIEEQHRIADFLDSETNRIDELSTLQARVLDGLRLRDQAVRDNLVESLFSETGEVPIRRRIRTIEQGSSPACFGYPRQSNEWGVIKLSAVKDGVFRPTENKKLPDDVDPVRQFEIRDGDLLVTRANTPGLVGDAAVVEGAGRGLLLPDLIYRIVLEPEVLAEFAAQILLSTRVRDLIRASARGSSQSMIKIRGEDIREWPIPRASSRQQQELVSAIRKELSSSAEARVAISRQRTVLAERRQALITAAVTGQIDVTTARGVAV